MINKIKISGISPQPDSQNDDLGCPRPCTCVDAPGYSWPYTLSLVVTHSHGYHRLGVSENQANISPQFSVTLFPEPSPTWPSYII